METELSIPTLLTASDALQLLQERPNMRIVDIRSVEEYDRGHISRAINLTWRMIDELNTIGWDKTSICLVVGGVAPQDTMHAQDALQSLGFNSVVLKDGMESWMSAGLPIVESSSRGKFCCGRGCGCE